MVGTTPPVFDVWPLLGRWPSPPGPVAITAEGASMVVPATRPAVSQLVRRRVAECVMSWSPSAVGMVFAVSHRRPERRHPHRRGMVLGRPVPWSASNPHGPHPAPAPPGESGALPHRGSHDPGTTLALSRAGHGTTRGRGPPALGGAGGRAARG